MWKMGFKCDWYWLFWHNIVAAVVYWPWDIGVQNMCSDLIRNQAWFHIDKTLYVCVCPYWYLAPAVHRQSTWICQQRHLHGTEHSPKCTHTLYYTHAHTAAQLLEATNCGCSPNACALKVLPGNASSLAFSTFYHRQTIIWQNQVFSGWSNYGNIASFH